MSRKPDFSPLIPGTRDYKRAEDARSEMLHHLSLREHTLSPKAIHRLRELPQAPAVRREVKGYPYKDKMETDTDMRNRRYRERCRERSMWRKLIREARRTKRTLYVTEAMSVPA